MNNNENSNGFNSLYGEPVNSTEGNQTPVNNTNPVPSPNEPPANNINPILGPELSFNQASNPNPATSVSQAPVNNTNPVPSSNETPANNINPILGPELSFNQANNPNPAPSIPQTPSNNMNSSQQGEEELIRAFVGPNYEKIAYGKFNPPAFFFNIIYFFYRKLFLYGIAAYILNLIVLNLINNEIVTIIFFIVLGLVFNKLYLEFAKNKVRKIKAKNSDKSFEEIKGICAAKGGTSVGRAILGFVLMIIIGIITLVILIFVGVSSALVSLLNSAALTSDGVYNGGITYDTSVNVGEAFAVTVPTVFQDNSQVYEYDYQYTSNEGIFNNCSFNLSVPDGFSSSSNLIEQMAEYNAGSNPSQVLNTSINNINWDYFSYNGAFGLTYHYATTKDNKVYLISYEVQEDAPSDCDSYREVILNSITSK